MPIQPALFCLRNPAFQRLLTCQSVTGPMNNWCHKATRAEKAEEAKETCFSNVRGGDTFLEEKVHCPPQADNHSHSTEEAQHKAEPSSPRQRPSCPQRGNSLGTGVEKFMSWVLWSRAFRLGFLSPWELPYVLASHRWRSVSMKFQPKVSSSSNHCLQLPQPAAEAKECFPRSNS